MSVATLLSAIQERAEELRASALVERGVASHKKGWRNCPCSWCALKREATSVIGTIPHAYIGPGILVEDRRDIYRDTMRKRYRQKLAALEAEVL